MRPHLAKPRQCNLWFIVTCILAGVLIFNTNFLNFSGSMFCSTSEETVAVPVQEIMRGQPVILPQNDPKIIQYIWSKNLLQPPSETPYDLYDTSKDPSRGQGQLIRKILKNMTNGFFVECGALDGETRSNTLTMELQLGWKGLLVEADPSNYKKLLTKNRKAWSSNTCLAVKPYPHQVKFLQNFNIGKILGEIEDYVLPSSASAKSLSPERTIGVAKVQCMPLFSLLTALNVSVVDYFSLDVEGNELQVLKTIPFDKVLIKTLSVEFFHTAEGKEELLNFMLSKGYGFAGKVVYRDNLANDLIFVHPSVAKLSKVS